MTIKLKKHATIEGFGFAQIIEACLNVPNPGKNFSIAEIRTGHKILDKLEDAQKAQSDNEIRLEEKEVKLLKSAFEKTQWSVIDPILIEFDDALNA